jgi:hypothetical protein
MPCDLPANTVAGATIVTGLDPTDRQETVAVTQISFFKNVVDGI